MRTRAENLSILRNASGGSFSAGGPSGERVRSRDESLRILSPMTPNHSWAALNKGAPVGEPWNPPPSAPSTSSGAYAPPSPQGEGLNTQGTGNEAQTELDRLKPVLEEAKRLKTERDRYISGAMRDPAKSYSAQTRLDHLLEKTGYRG